MRWPQSVNQIAFFSGFPGHGWCIGWRFPNRFADGGAFTVPVNPDHPSGSATPLVGPHFFGQFTSSFHVRPSRSISAIDAVGPQLPAA